MTRRELYQAFQHEFPLESLKDMPLDKYTNLNKEDSFCYWLESRTYDLGSFWGGSSYKFLIYRYNNKPAEGDPRIISDDKYAWYSNLGKDTAEEAYQVVRDEIVKVATFANQGDYDAIDTLDRLGHSYKWKIAFLYSKEKLIPIYNRGLLNIVAQELGMRNVQKARTSEIQKFLMQQKGDKDLFDFYEELLNILDSKNQDNSFDAVKSAMIEKLENSDRFVAKKSGKSFLWIGTKDGIIGHDACHYEICADADRKAGHKKDYVYVEMHHEGKKASLFKVMRDIEGIKPFNWLIYGERLNDDGRTYKDKDLDDLTNELIKDLYDLDDIVGNKAREIVQIEKKNSRNSVSYWLYAPGEQAIFWNEYYQDGIMGLGWDKIGDLKDYRKQEDLIAPLKLNYGEDSSQVQNANMLYNFAYDMKPGDVVFAKKGRSLIVGRGVITSDYYYDGNREYHPHLRKVEWKNKGEWKTDSLLAMKTLTNITRLPELVIYLNSMIDGDSDEQKTQISTKNAYNPYNNDDFLKEVFVTQADLFALESLLLRKKNLILQGAPGVGKTYAARRLAYAIMGEKNEDRVLQVQFHQNYSYEDFVMGYKPNKNGGFDLRPGKFYNFCKVAEKDRDHKYFFIIDEINRGNLSKIFGELLMLIECDYRDKEIELSYSDEKFSVPSNIYIIGMMNTADRSLAMIDYALRRRFSFFEMRPGFKTDAFNNHILGWSSTKLRKLIDAIIELNKVITEDDSLGSGFCIGHSYLCNFKNGYDLDGIVEYDIIPMLREYWFDNDNKFNQESQKLRNALK